jgi:hypothetical protein
MSQATRLAAIATQMGTDVKALRIKIGDLTALVGFDSNTDVAVMLQELLTKLTGLDDALNDTNAGAGLATDGDYIQDNATSYIKLASTLANADKLLDAQLKIVTDRVASIEAGGSGVQIDDNAGEGDVGVVWSADKTLSEIVTNRQELKDELLGGVGAAYDTLKELADKLTAEGDIIVGLVTAVGEKVSYAEVQTLTTAQKLQACQNIGIGDPEQDLLAVYNAAKL